MTSTYELLPRSPISPETLASQPGTPRLKCQGSLSVIVGAGAISFDSSSAGPARIGLTAANSAHAKKNNFIFMAGILWLAKLAFKKIPGISRSSLFGALETKAGHQT